MEPAVGNCGRSLCAVSLPLASDLILCGEEAETSQWYSRLSE